MIFPTDYQEFLDIIFSPPNKITRQVIESTSTTNLDIIKKEAIQWLQAINEKKDIPLLVPYLKDNNVVWYACCNDLSQFEQVNEELTSFVSGVYANVIKPAKDDNAQEVGIITQYFNSLYLKLIPIIDKEKELYEALSIYRQLLKRRPIRAIIGSRPEGRIRYDFEQALLTNNEQKADACIEEWRLTGRLSHQNHRFLLVRKLSALGRWSQIVNNPDYLRCIIDLKLPVRIQADLLEALYNVYLIQFEQASDYEGLKKEFIDKVKNRYGNLFKSRRGINLNNVIKMFLLNEITKENPDIQACDELLRQYDKSDVVGLAYFTGIVDELKKTTTDISASKAFDDGDYDRALNLYLKCDIDEKVLARILMCASFVDSMDTLQNVLKVCNDNESLITKLPKRWQQVINDLKSQFDIKSKTVSDWYSLLELICEGGDPQNVIKIAENGVIQWSIDDIIISTDRVISFANLMIKAYEKNQSLMKDIFPYLYQVFTCNTKKEDKLLPIYRNLLFLIAFADTLSDDDIELAKNLSSILIKYETNAKNYKDIIDLLIHIWERKKSIYYLDWGLDIAELFVIYPSADFKATVSFFDKILQLVTQKKSYVNKGQWIILEQLSKDYGFVEYFESIKPKETTEEKEVSTPLKGKKVGIYTLEEQAGKRAKEVIEKLYSGVKVDVNSDHEATNALINLAKTSDIFIFAWKSAKHQALYCIQDNIKHKENLLQPIGKGTTSILRSLEGFILQRSA